MLKSEAFTDSCSEPEKHPQQRLRHVGDFELLLHDEPQAVQPRQSRNRVLAASAAILAFALLVLTARYFRQSPREGAAIKFSILPPEKASFNSYPAISPDGRHLAFVATTDDLDRLWVRDLDSLSVRVLAGTEGATGPFWSPDSRLIAFFADKKLKKIDLSGGPTIPVCDTGLYPIIGSWGKNDIIVFNSSGRRTLSRVSAAGGPVSEVTQAEPVSGEIGMAFPFFLPDGHRLLYTSINAEPEKTGIYLGDLDSKTHRKLVNIDSNAVYAPPGYLVFRREQTLMAQRFDASTGQTSGDALPIAAQVDYEHQYRDLGRFSLSENGVLAYIGGNVRDLQLTWFDRSGKALGTVGTPGVIGFQEISPDGTWVAVPRLDPRTSNWDIWLYDLKRDGAASRFTVNLKSSDDPEWSPDSRRIVFRSNRGGRFRLYQKKIDGSSEEVIDESPNLGEPMDWSHDGRYILKVLNDPKTHNDIWVVPLFGERKPFPYLTSEFNENLPKLSPDGRWAAYFSDETGRMEVYVQSFPIAREKYQVSLNGGWIPNWSADGKELFFITPDRKLMAVKVKTGEKFQAGVPRLLFETHFTGFEGYLAWFNATQDGRFLIAVPVEQPTSVPITLAVNSIPALKK